MLAFHFVRVNFYKWFKYNNKIVLSNQYHKNQNYLRVDIEYNV